MTAAKRIYLALAQADLHALVAEQVAALPGCELADALPADLVVADSDGDEATPRVVLGRAGGIALPLRLGALNDQIRYTLSARAKHAPRDDAPLTLGPFLLHAADSTLVHRDSGQAIRLTDKERLFLQTLHAAPGHTLGRKDLLDAVWDYAEGVETHTLETHLYRLRQKLDACGGSGLILSADGLYTLKI